MQAEHNATRESAERKEVTDDLPSHVAAHVKEISVQRKKKEQQHGQEEGGRANSKTRSRKKPKPKESQTPAPTSPSGN